MASFSSSALLAVFLAVLALTVDCQTTNPAFVPGLTWVNARSLIPRRTYPACTYNIHAPVDATPLMFMLGGEVNYTNQVLANDVWYSTHGFVTDSHQIVPNNFSYVNQPNTTAFVDRRGGAAALLANGNLLCQEDP